MADLTSTRAAIQAALDEADTALNQPTTSQTIANLQAQVTKLQGIVDQVKALVNG